MGSLYVNMSRIVRVKQFLTELARIVSRKVLVFNVVDHVVLLGACLRAFQTLKQVDIHFLEAHVHKIQIS